MPELDGVLFFPVTPFHPAGTLNLPVLAEHVERGVAAGPGAVFVACGTGEYHALDSHEYEQIVATAVKATSAAAPVFAGVGGPLPVAQAGARAAQVAGADGLLLLPPYLVDAPTAGLVAYVATVAATTDLPVIVYHRAQARFDPDSAATVAQIPTVVGLKDGVGDLDLLGRIIVAVDAALGGAKPFQFFNGLPTAEMTSAAYQGIGVRVYSSATFCFAPEISLAFYDALTGGNHGMMHTLTAEFFAPLVALRATVPGYAVSLVKAGVGLRGLDVGGVRPPLLDPSPADLSELERILKHGLGIVGANR